MKPLRIVLALAAVASAGTGIIATYNQSVPLASRVGPGWFRAASLYGGTALLLVGVVVAIASVQAGAGRHGPAGPRGLRLGRGTLWVGALSLVAGLLWPALPFLHLVPPMPFLSAGIKLAPLLVAIGAVLLGSSAAAVRCEASDPPRDLTLGRGTLGTGSVLLALGWFALEGLPGVDRGLGLFGFIIWMDSFPTGLALVGVGALLLATERAQHRDQEAVGSRGPNPDPV